MKKSILMTILFCMLFCMPVFANTILWNGLELRSSPYTEQDFDKSGDVTFTIEHSIYGKDIEKIIYLFENHTTEQPTYGQEAELEVLLNGQWYQIPLNRTINAIGYGLKNGKGSGVFYWNTEKYHLTEGKYRLIKELNDMSYGKLGSFGERKYNAEFEIGDSIYTKNTPYGYQKLENLSKEYSKEMAVKNKDVVFVEDGEQKNTEKLTEFIEKINLRIPAFLRITRYLKNGDVIITDLEYDDHYIYQCDKTRTQSNTLIGKEYPYLITDGNNIYVSNWASWDLKQKYQGESGEYLFSKGNGENAAASVNAVKAMTEKRIQNNITEYKVENKEIYFNEKDAIEKIIAEEQNKGHYDVKVLNIKWYGEQEFLVTIKAYEGEYRVLYDLKTEKTKDFISSK